MKRLFQLNWVISEENAGKTVREFLKNERISKAALTDIKFHGGDICVDRKHVTVTHVLKKGERLTVIFPEEQPSDSLISEKIDLDIVFEDDYLVIVNKPPFMNTIPSREHPTGSLANGLNGYYETLQLTASPHIVTRLDRNTSGLVLVAKHRHIHHLLSMQQQEQKIRRIYEAFVSGTLKTTAGRIVAPIARKKTSIIEREVSADGQYAVTNYSLIIQNEDFAHVNLQLETGRTHQIRVHMAYMGHPLLGDDLYGGSLNNISRQALHCKEIAFIHPVTNEEQTFVIPLPADMNNLLARF
ncbi:RluA family pseudouridine synthase [Bacillus kwashiorkori]|uniref:RluA family pseudouridine synthase n=1 Tax=Bacillus kwashiorkori TaxID=1522318 RepID=UPI0007852573|nr:RluA family pseudouridine synthase [Bacillus kwashiorkori]